MKSEGWKGKQRVHKDGWRIRGVVCHVCVQMLVVNALLLLGARARQGSGTKPECGLESMVSPIALLSRIGGGRDRPVRASGGQGRLEGRAKAGVGLPRRRRRNPWRWRRG